MNVLIVNHRLDAEGGGTARKAVTLANALRDSGVNVELATLAMGHNGGSDACSKTECVPFAIRRWPIPTGNVSGVVRQVRRADVILLVNHWTTINALYAMVAWRYGTPVVVMPCGALPIFGRSIWLKHLFNAAIGRRIVRQAVAAIAITTLETSDFERYGVPPSRVEVIPNSVNPAEAAKADPARFRQRWQQGRPFILYAGRLAAIKGPDLLLDAWHCVAATTSFDLVIVGAAGEMTGHVERWIDAHGRDARVRWIGPLERDDLVDGFSAAHAFVVPSRSEAMSLVLLEAALTGCPVIATSACGVPGVAAHGGVEVAPTEDALADALADALRWTPEEARARGARLEAYVRATYTWPAVMPLYLDVLRRATGSLT